MKQQRAVKVELYPTDEQRILIHKTFGCVRAVWNDMLGDEQEFYAAADKHFIPTPAKYKKKRPYLSEVDSLALCNAQLALKKAFKRFFKNPGHFGHPKFKTKKKAKKSYTTNCQYHVSGPTVYTAKDAIRLPKLGLVKAKLYRNTHDNWVLKSATISETKSGRIFCALLYEFDVPVPKEVLPTPENSIGLDYSSPLFYVDHENRSPDKPQWFRESEAKLAHEQRLLSHMKYGSKNHPAAPQNRGASGAHCQPEKGLCAQGKQADSQRLRSRVRGGPGSAGNGPKPESGQVDQRQWVWHV